MPALLIRIEARLKCSRQSPCDQCSKRSLSTSCRFVPYERPHSTQQPPPHLSATSSSATSSPASRIRSLAGDPDALQARLRHLEHLVLVLKSQRRSLTGHESAAHLTQGNVCPRDDPEHDPLLVCPVVRNPAGVIGQDLRYVDSANWEAVLDDVSPVAKQVVHQ